MRPATCTIVTAALAVLVLFPPGCGSTPSRYYYALVNDAAAGPPSARRGDRPVMVPAVEISVPYDNDRITYRTGAHEVKRFNYRLWVSLPQDMVRQLLVRKLEQTGIFRSVEPRMHGSRDAYLLLARIDAIELLYTGEHVEARLAMTMRLRDSGTDRDVWTHSFDDRRRVPDDRDEVAAAVRVLSAIYNAEIDRALVLLADHISRSG